MWPNTSAQAQPRTWPHAPSLLAAVGTPCRSHDRVSFVGRDKPSRQKGVRGCDQLSLILSVVSPGAARGWARAGDELIDAATVLTHDCPGRSVRALVLVIRHAIAIAVHGGNH